MVLPHPGGETSGPSYFVVGWTKDGGTMDVVLRPIPEVSTENKEFRGKFGNYIEDGRRGRSRRRAKTLGRL